MPQLPVKKKKQTWPVTVSEGNGPDGSWLAMVGLEHRLSASMVGPLKLIQHLSEHGFLRSIIVAG